VSRSLPVSTATTTKRSALKFELEGCNSLDLSLFTDYFLTIHSFIKGTGKFPIHKCAIFCKFKDIKGLRGGVLLYAAQAIPPIDAEIAEKGHIWTETNYDRQRHRPAFGTAGGPAVVR